MTAIAAFTTESGVSVIEAKSDETRNSFKMDRIIARSFGKIDLTKHYTRNKFSHYPFTYQISAVGMCVAEKYVNN